MACHKLSEHDEDLKKLDSSRFFWVDDRYELHRNTRKQLETIEQYFVLFKNLERFQRFINENKSRQAFILIMNIDFALKFVPTLDKLFCISLLIVYYVNEPSDKIRTAFENKERVTLMHADRIIPTVRFGQRIVQESAESSSDEFFISNAENSTESVESKFIFSQALMDCILRMKPNEKDREELMKYLEPKYTYRTGIGGLFTTFKANYTKETAIHCYSSNDVFYENINRALRKQDISMIVLWRSYVLDLSNELAKIQYKGHAKLYRGQRISKQELEKLKSSIGRLISVTSFFSTSTDVDIARLFAESARSCDSTVSVKFIIEADHLMVNDKPFANISSMSQYSTENEILFMAGSIFRINNVYENTVNGGVMWSIEMSLCDPDNPELEAVTNYMRRQNGIGETNLETLGLLLLRMGETKLAEYYLKRYLDEISSDDIVRKRVYDHLSSILIQKGDHDGALEFSKKAMELEKSMIPYTIIPIINEKARWTLKGDIIAGAYGRGNGLKCLSSPEGIFIDINDVLCIADWQNNRILECNCDGDKMRVLFDKSHAIDQYQCLFQPTNIIHDKKSNILVIAENGRRRVIQVHYKTNPIKIDLIAEDIACWGLAMDIQGALYVSDIENHVVLQFDRQEKYGKGRIVAGGNGKGSNDRQLNVPRYIFVDNKLDVYVSDQENHRVMRWAKGAKEGVLVAGSQSAGSDFDKLQCPSGIVVDKNGVIYIADTDNYRVMRWRKNEKCGETIVGRTGCSGGTTELNEPTSLAFDSLGNIYVSDKNNHRILRFYIC